MKKVNYLGVAISVIGFFTGLLLFYLLAENYMIVVDGKNAGGRPDEALAVIITSSMLGWLGIGASGLWGAVLYGFATNQEWSWRYGKIAAALQMLAGFFPTIPAKSIDLPAATMPVFLIATVLWFGIMYIGKVNRKVLIFLFLAGMAYVLSYMNGVAIISKYQTTTYNDVWKGMYAVIFGVTWIASTTWLVVSYGVLQRKSYVIPLGIMAAIMSIIPGYSLAIVNIIEKGRFSMFLLAPLVSTFLLIYLVLPAAKKLLTTWEEKTFI
ncbi:MAG: hypothetical protein JW922_05510 [Paludibacteraceae bacterium]|nr:hypothetical protein [Paludibacteraceae bacterium]